MFSTGRQPPTGNARLARLSSRWNDLRAEMDRDKQHRRESLEDQLLMVEDMGNRDAMTLELKIKQFKDRIKQPEETIHEMKAQSGKQDQEFKDQVREVEQGTSDIDDYCEEWNRTADQKIITVCSTLESIQQKAQDQLQSTYNQLLNRVNYTEKLILMQKTKRQEVTTQLTEDMESELNRLHDELGIEKKIREQTQSKIFKMIEEVNQKLEEEVKSQRQQRLNTKAALTRLLEETCRKVEMNFR